MATPHSTDSDAGEPSGSVFSGDRIVTVFLRHDVVKLDDGSFIQCMKQSQLRHALHSLKKGSLSVRAYVDKIKGLCTLLAASGSSILEAERSAILLSDISSEFDAVVSFASLFSTPLLFQWLVDALLECEAHQLRSVQKALVVANFVEGSSTQEAARSSRGGRSFARG
ncbi:hypothetical protein J1N35_000601 [Gossypium stocksii]|uniref:Uncharacterized protein n=1 Tax=Gossypium stocksii TaxID=47602 RepID=A0A9D3WJ19_9ROSI|nr:hypothetical protein J1N35_000601 [Gossypium stocksii]